MASGILDSLGILQLVAFIEERFNVCVADEDVVYENFYSIGAIWERAHIVKSYKARLAFLLVSKLYRQMYANTGIATDSARVSRSTRWARWLARPCRKLFVAAPMPELQVPQ